MSYLSRLVVAVTILCASCLALDRNAFTFIKYDFELRANPEESAIAARGKITLRNDSSQPQTHAALQISSSLEWRMIESGGTQLEYLTEPQTSDIDHTGKLNEAIVTLPGAVPPKGTVELEIGYSGVIPKDGTRLIKAGLPEAAALASDWDRVSPEFTAVRGIGHVAWYPIATEASSIGRNTVFSAISRWQQRQAEAEMKVRFCWVTDEDRSYTVAANGDFNGLSSANAELEGARTGCTSYAYRNLTETIPSFAIGSFEMLTRPAIAIYSLAGHQAQASDFAISAEKVQPWIEEWFGKVTSKVQVIELPDANDIPFDAGIMLFTPLNNKDKKFVEVTMAHQLTHAAFKSPRPWISEGLAQFAQALVRERQDGRRAAIDFMHTRLPVLIAAEEQNAGSAKPSGDAAQSLISTTDEVYYRTKAMYVWWMLRDMLGDIPLQAVLKSYKGDQDRDPAYVQHLVAGQGKRDLEWFFDDWVYRDRGLPDFKIAAAASRETLSDRSVVAITVENAGGAGAEVPITVHMSNGEKSSRMVIRAKGKEVTRIAVPGKPTDVSANDGSVPEMDPSDNLFKLPE